MLFAFLLSRWSFVRNSDLPQWFLPCLLIVKVAVGILYGWIHLHDYGGTDTWGFIKNSRVIYESFFDNPAYFFELVFGPNSRIPPDYLEPYVRRILSWSDVRTYTMFRINAPLHFISGGYYNVHAVFHNFFAVLGLFALYKSFRSQLSAHKWTLILLVFGIPSVLFWGSGIHKESISLLGLGMLFYSTFYNQTELVIWKRISLFALGIALLLLLRPYLVGLFLPAVFAWFLFKKFQQFNWLKIGYLSFYLSLLLVAHTIGTVIPKLNVFQKLADIQYVYIMFEKGNSDVRLDQLYPDAIGFLSLLPQAFKNTLLCPNWNHISTFYTFLASVETILLLLIAFAALFFRKKIPRSEQNFILACLFFALSYVALIGILSDNLGTLVRYRSILLPFLLLYIIYPATWPKAWFNTILTK